ncbi:MAG: hypothetical protein M3P33_01600, partial [bacterium]|nr:hypothetical protein [bacterium]
VHTGSVEEIKAKSEALSSVMQKIGAAMYSQASSAAPGGGDSGTTGGDGNTNDNTTKDSDNIKKDAQEGEVIG